MKCKYNIFLAIAIIFNIKNPKSKPFIFTSVHRSISNLLIQYMYIKFTDRKNIEQYKNISHNRWQSFMNIICRGKN